MGFEGSIVWLTLNVGRAAQHGALPFSNTKGPLRPRPNRSGPAWHGFSSGLPAAVPADLYRELEFQIRKISARVIKRFHGLADAQPFVSVVNSKAAEKQAER